ncbi:zinc finger CCCH domain-containing protein 43-like [Vitis riparia]|nr:zinc finger CCCH domain-containing protein 43-like [Vitis riparia]
MHPPPAFVINNTATDANVYGHHQQQQQSLIEDFPERPGQPECSYFLKTGDCKFRAACKYHHPKNRIPKSPPCTLSDKGLPLRPDQNICTHYNRYGICKFGPACKFDHPVNYGNSASAPSAESGQDQPPPFGGSVTADGVRPGSGNGNEILIQQPV